MCPAARDFFTRQGDLTQKYFVYFKSNQRHMAEKDSSFGYVGNFQTSPRAGLVKLTKAICKRFSPCSRRFWLANLNASAIDAASEFLFQIFVQSGGAPKRSPGVIHTLLTRQPSHNFALNREGWGAGQLIKPVFIDTCVTCIMV